MDHQPIPATGLKNGAPTIYPLSGGKVHGQATPQTCPQLKTYEPSSRKSQLGWAKEKLQIAWEKIKPETLENLYNGIPNRIKKCIKLKGEYINK